LDFPFLDFGEPMHPCLPQAEAEFNSELRFILGGLKPDRGGETNATGRFSWSLIAKEEMLTAVIPARSIGK
jgi:hypothetical protein